MTRPFSLKHRTEKFEEPAVNLTPLIDVVFVILIMFIVVAPLLELDRVELADAPSAPLDHHLPVSEASPISIHVHPDNSIWFNNSKVALADLGDLLKTAKAKHPQAKPQLFCDKKASFGIYQGIKNACESAGFEQLDVVLNPV